MLSGLGSWFGFAFKDWRSFIGGPGDPVFSQGATFEKDWARIVRLIAFVTLIASPFLGISLASPGATVYNFLVGSRVAWIALAGAATLAVLYSSIVAPLFGVRIGFSQWLFCELSLGLSWLPVASLVWWLWSTTYAMASQSPVIGIFVCFVIIKPLHNIGRGVCKITGSAGRARWRVWLSIWLPPVLLLISYLFLSSTHHSK